MCAIAEDWFEFGQKVASVLHNCAAFAVAEEERQRIRSALAPDVVYGELASWLDGATTAERRP